MGYFLVIVFCLAISVHQGEAIRCYVCSSARDPGCRDPFEKSHHIHKLTECTQDNVRNINDIIPGIMSHFPYHTTHNQDFACVKAVTRERGQETVVRSCSIPRTDTFDVCAQLRSRDLEYCQSCNHDSCNSSWSLAPHSFTVLAALALLTTVANSKQIF